MKNRIDIYEKSLDMPMLMGYDCIILNIYILYDTEQEARYG
jgi:hypothetical protein